MRRAEEAEHATIGGRHAAKREQDNEVLPAQTSKQRRNIMAKRIPVEISTTNKNLKGTDGSDLKIEVAVQAEVPETLQEAAEFYGSEEKLIESIQGDVARRKANAARPLLRDAEQQGDWTSIAQQAVDQYTPGRKPGFGQAPTIAEEELRSASDMESLLALLRQKGFNIQSGGSQEQNEDAGSDENVEVGVEG